MVDFRMEQLKIQATSISTSMSMLLHYNVIFINYRWPHLHIIPAMMSNFSCTGQFYKHGTATNTVVLDMSTYGEK